MFTKSIITFFFNNFDVFLQIFIIYINLKIIIQSSKRN